MHWAEPSADQSTFRAASARMFKIEKLDLEKYPELMRVFEPPQAIYAKGRPDSLALLERLPKDGLAIVGTRRPQPRCESLARKTILELRSSRLIVISGLAMGIDTVAHQTALEAGLPTLAVLGSGVNQIYPRQNIPLAERIMGAGGLVVSEFEPHQEARPMNFLQRNRLIATWSQATWVVEAAHRSGALNTAKWAREHDRHCFATPAFPGDPALAGNLGLLDRVEADPLWNARCFGKVWIDLATLDERMAQPNLMQSASKENRMLASEVGILTAQQGGAQVKELLDWAIARNWRPEVFFVTLQTCLEKGWIRERSGILIPGA
jgi:DNA protecting protein DprA